MTIITPHCDDESLFMGEIVGHANKIVLLTDSGGSESFRVNHPDYGRERRAFFRQLHSHASILELNVRDGSTDADPDLLFDKCVNWINFPLVTINRNGHSNHSQAYYLGQRIARYYGKPFMVAWGYDDDLRLIEKPDIGTPCFEYATPANITNKNRLLREWSLWFRANYPTRWNHFLDLQIDRDDRITVERST